MCSVITLMRVAAHPLLPRASRRLLWVSFPAKVLPESPSLPQGNLVHLFPKESPKSQDVNVLCLSIGAWISPVAEDGLMRLIMLILFLSVGLLQPVTSKGLLFEFSLYYFCSVFPFYYYY